MQALDSAEESRWMSLIYSEVAGPNWLKLGGLVEGMGENVLFRVRGGMIQESETYTLIAG